MKRKLFFGLAGLAFVAAAAIVTISTINTNTPESDLLSKNLEALASGEGSGGHCSYCYSNYDYDCHVSINGDWATCEYMNWSGR
jgi:hypothetical protein